MPKTLKEHTMNMKTKYAKTSEIERKWHLIDAKDLSLGRLACKVAHLLSGKHKVEWAPHIDAGDFVVLINAENVYLSGRKWAQKSYYSHSRYVGSLKEKKASEMKPEVMITKAVQGMLPKNKLRVQMLKKLKVYTGMEHPHVAQKLTPFKI